MLSLSNGSISCRYYPSGHRDFLKRHPDVLGKKTRNKTRLPLWERAQKEKGKDENTEEGNENESAALDKTTSDTANRKQPEWWDDDWLAGVEGELGNYPLICRVERTQAEFPPDLDVLVDSKLVTEDGVQKVVFKQAKANKKSKHSNPPLCLAVVLKPMTPLVPPKWNADSCSLGNGNSLLLPPIFHVVTHPSKCAPFIIPFGYAYRVSHSLSLEEKVKSQNESQWHGIVKSFSSVGERYGNGRLEDNALRIADLLSFFKGEGAATLVSSLESSLVLSSGQKLTLPLADAGVVIDTMATVVDSRELSTSLVNSSKQDLEGSLITLIRGTLPLWKGVSVVAYNRKAVSVSAWDLVSSKVSSKGQSGGIYAALTGHVLADNGLMYHIDEALRAKVECSLEDFTEKNEDSFTFWDPVTDSIAPSYSCAVPLGMCFQKILRRLHCRKTTTDERKHCYYRTLDSMLSDVGTILDNTVLYNSPDSEVVLQGDRVIPQAKILIEQVVNRHQKERTAREKADEERKKKIMLQYNAAACVQSSPSAVQVSESKTPKSRRSSLSKEEQTTQGPFMEPLHRSWIEGADRDTSWNVAVADSAQSTKGRSLFQEWVPQSGDVVLYSRLLHSKFIKGHHESLLTDQCSLPQFVLHTKDTGSDGNSGIIDKKAGAMEANIDQTPSRKDQTEDQHGIRENEESNLREEVTPSAAYRPSEFSMKVQINGKPDGAELSASRETNEEGIKARPSASAQKNAKTDERHQSDMNNSMESNDVALVEALHSQWLVGRVVWVRH